MSTDIIRAEVRIGTNTMCEAHGIMCISNEQCQAGQRTKRLLAGRFVLGQIDRVNACQSEKSMIFPKCTAGWKVYDVRNTTYVMYV